MKLLINQSGRPTLGWFSGPTSSAPTCFASICPIVTCEPSERNRLVHIQPEPAGPLLLGPQAGAGPAARVHRHAEGCVSESGFYPLLARHLPASLSTRHSASLRAAGDNREKSRVQSRRARVAQPSVSGTPLSRYVEAWRPAALSGHHRDAARRLASRHCAAKSRRWRAAAAAPASSARARSSRCSAEPRPRAMKGCSARFEGQGGLPGQGMAGRQHRHQPVGTEGAGLQALGIHVGSEHAQFRLAAAQRLGDQRAGLLFQLDVGRGLGGEEVGQGAGRCSTSAALLASRRTWRAAPRPVRPVRRPSAAIDAAPPGHGWTGSARRPSDGRPGRCAPAGAHRRHPPGP